MTGIILAKNANFEPSAPYFRLATRQDGKSSDELYERPDVFLLAAENLSRVGRCSQPTFYYSTVEK